MNGLYYAEKSFLLTIEKVLDHLVLARKQMRTDVGDGGLGVPKPPGDDPDRDPGFQKIGCATMAELMDLERMTKPRLRAINPIKARRKDRRRPSGCKRPKASSSP